MKKIILLAGYPATGKTYMSEQIKKYLPKSMYISQDEFKELLYDKIGFDNLAEKDEVVEIARSMFYQTVEKSIEKNEIILLDYPFSYKQLSFLDSIKEKYHADFLTIRLVGDLDILYDRRVERDLVPSRNKGHILDVYHGYESYTRETYPLSREQYKNNCIKGKYDEFVYGRLIPVDVSDYAAIDYDSIKEQVIQFIEAK